MKILTIFLAIFLTTLSAHSNETSHTPRVAIENNPDALSKEIQELEAEIQKDMHLYQNRPRMRPSDSLKNNNENSIREYADDCYRKILNVANLKILKGAKEGAVAARFEIYPSGHVKNIKIIESSGNPATDETIRQAILLAAPFNEFSEKIKKVKSIAVTRRFTFKKTGNQAHRID